MTGTKKLKEDFSNELHRVGEAAAETGSIKNNYRIE